jgi:hypothetical protein
MRNSGERSLTQLKGSGSEGGAPVFQAQIEKEEPAFDRARKRIRQAGSGVRGEEMGYGYADAAAGGGEGGDQVVAIEIAAGGLKPATFAGSSF